MWIWASKCRCPRSPEKGFRVPRAVGSCLARILGINLGPLQKRSTSLQPLKYLFGKDTLKPALLESEAGVIYRGRQSKFQIQPGTHMKPRLINNNNDKINLLILCARAWMYVYASYEYPVPQRQEKRIRSPALELKGCGYANAED